MEIIEVDLRIEIIERMCTQDDPQSSSTKSAANGEDCAHQNQQPDLSQLAFQKPNTPDIKIPISNHTVHGEGHRPVADHRAAGTVPSSRALPRT